VRFVSNSGNTLAVLDDIPQSVFDDIAQGAARQKAWDDFTPPAGFTKNADNTITTSDGTVYTPNFADDGFELTNDGYTQFTSADGNTIKIYTENPAGRGADFDWLKDHNITPADTYTKKEALVGGIIKIVLMRLLKTSVVRLRVATPILICQGLLHINIIYGKKIPQVIQQENFILIP